VDQVAWDDQRHVLTLAGLTLAAPAPTVPRLASDEGLPAVASDRVIETSVVNQHG
jgi:hypothetical protein